MERFMRERFEEWENNTHIPKEVMDMVCLIADKIGIGSIFEDTITIRNRGGYICGYGKGFTLSYCTSSYESGPGVNYAPTFMKWIKGLGFRVENSYGDNGMDSSTNWQDTYWHTEIIYEPSIVWDDFYEYDDDDY